MTIKIPKPDTKVVEIKPKIQPIKVSTLGNTVEKVEELLKRQGRTRKTNKAEENGELVRVSIFIS